MLKTGIYKITNTTNGRIYIGSATNLTQRKGDHFSKLRKQIHRNRYLQNSYNLHGKDAFQFNIIEFCDRGILVEREQFYIDTLKPEYNILKVARSPLGIEISKESRQLAAKSMKLRLDMERKKADLEQSYRDSKIVITANDIKNRYVILPKEMI